MAKKHVQPQPEPAASSSPTFRIVGLHPNIRNPFVMQTRKSYNLDELSEAEAAELLAIGWEHIESIPNP